MRTEVVAFETEVPYTEAFLTRNPNIRGSISVGIARVQIERSVVFGDFGVPYSISCEILS